MKRVYPYLKNKYIISSIVVLLYIIILHDTDIFALRNRMNNSDELRVEIEQRKKDIEELKIALSDLDDPRALEKFAREHHLYKKDDEDLFTISFK
ncbi:MAG: septum formation initiator family protein [Crocinitomicaceae bacterium]